MGVNLTPIMIRHPTSLEALRGRTIAVDGNLELYQFLSIMRTREGQPLMDSRGRVTSHLNGLLTRTTRLIADYDIRPVFVFDGPPPDLKQAEISRRREAREKARQEYETALIAGDVGTAWSKAVMTSRLTRDMVDEAKTLLGYLGIPWVQAPSEGEAQAAFLASRGDVWAAGSKDYDALLFGAPGAPAVPRGPQPGVPPEPRTVPRRAPGDDRPRGEPGRPRGHTEAAHRRGDPRGDRLLQRPRGLRAEDRDKARPRVGRDRSRARPGHRPSPGGRG